MKTLILSALCVLCVRLSQAASVTFAWDWNPPAGLTNPVTYVLKWGATPAAYTQQTNAGSATTLTVSSLLIGTNYVAAFSKVNGVESDPSNEIMVMIKPPAPGNLRVPIQGAGSPSGPWTNIVEFTVPIELTNSPAGFFRALAVIERQ